LKRKIISQTLMSGSRTQPYPCENWWLHNFQWGLHNFIKPIIYIIKLNFFLFFYHLHFYFIFLLLVSLCLCVNSLCICVCAYIGCDACDSIYSFNWSEEAHNIQYRIHVLSVFVESCSAVAFQSTRTSSSRSLSTQLPSSSSSNRLCSGGKYPSEMW